MSAGSGRRFVALTERAASGDREAARALIIGGWWPTNWDADDETAQDRVIEGSRHARRLLGPEEAPPLVNVNTITTASGLIRAVCMFCGRRSAPHRNSYDVAGGWSVAPYPDGYTHADGSTGSLFTCPTCHTRLNRGARLHPRQEVRHG